MNAAKLFWGYEPYEEAQLYVDAYFLGEIDVQYDPSKHVKKKGGKYVLPTLTSYIKCMILCMFFH